MKEVASSPARRATREYCELLVAHASEVRERYLEAVRTQVDPRFFEACRVLRALSTDTGAAADQRRAARLVVGALERMYHRIRNHAPPRRRMGRDKWERLREIDGGHHHPGMMARLDAFPSAELPSTFI